MIVLVCIVVVAEDGNSSGCSSCGCSCCSSNCSGCDCDCGSSSISGSRSRYSSSSSNGVIRVGQLEFSTVFFLLNLAL